METWIVSGGKPLEGTVEIHGAKNAVLPILAATVLHGGVYRLHHCPEITDVQLAAEIIEALGGAVPDRPEPGGGHHRRLPLDGAAGTDGPDAGLCPVPGTAAGPVRPGGADHARRLPAGAAAH